MSEDVSVSYATDEERWQALVRRDPRAKGHFLYAVATTGVYCQPGCPSRLPRRSNVSFFASCAEARRRGFRACKKCRPRPVHPAILRACRLLEEAEEPPALEELARQVGLSPFYLQRLFKEVVGITPRAYVAAQRVERLQNGLARAGSITTAILAAGFASSSPCYEGIAERLGMTPTEYRKGGAGQRIRLAIAPCYLGHAVVAATERGICTIALDDSPEALRGLVARRFPAAELCEGDPAFEAWVAQVLALIEAPARGVDLPLDIQGTAFQQRVWQALRAIPAGTTASYTEIARRIGRPSAVRAVARACADNPVAVIIPCHRVVRSDGGISGYRWGVERKRALLEREAGKASGKGEEAGREEEPPHPGPLSP